MHENTDTGTPYKVATLIFPIESGNYLTLGLKKRGFGAGKFNGFGGKIEQGETIREGALRELSEETNIPLGNLNIKLLKQIGKVRFRWPDKPENNMVVHVFWYTIVGAPFRPRDSEEMTPVVFSPDALPWKNMWPDDSLWLRALLETSGFTQVVGNFAYDNVGRLTEFEMQVAGNLIADDAADVVPLKAIE